MSSWPEAPVRSSVFRDGEVGARPARLTADLSTTGFAPIGVTDARLVDPVLAAAVEEAENAARSRGFKAGYAAGVLQGRHQAAEEAAVVARRRAELDDAERAERSAYIQALAANVREAIDGVLLMRERSFDELREQIAEMTVDLAEALVGRHLQVDEHPARDAVLRALREVPSNSSVVLRLNPSDVEDISGVADTFADWEILKIFADEDVEAGGCIAVSENLTVDARLTRALTRVRRALEA